MKKLIDYYKILGTNREALDYKGMGEKKRTEMEIDEFLREKYEHAIKMNKIKKNANPKRAEELEKEEQLIEYAYEQVSSPIKREMYHKFLEERKRAKSPLGVFLKVRTAYDDLNTTMKALEYRTERENDMVLAKKKDKLIEKYTRLLETATNFKEKQKIKLEIQRILQSYELVKTKERRNKYKKVVEKKQEEYNAKVRKKIIKQRYSHEKDFREDLIANYETDGKQKIRMVARKRNPSPIEHKLKRKNGERISLREIATIGFKNWEGVYSHLYEYEVKRLVKNEEKVDKIATELSIFELSTDESKGIMVNPQYYDCVVNRLLSEERIEGAKYNGGYIGSVEKDANGNYYTTIDEKNFKYQDQEKLAAVMILKQQEEKVKEKQAKSDQNRKGEER